MCLKKGPPCTVRKMGRAQPPPPPPLVQADEQIVIILELNNSGEVVRLKLLVRGKQFIAKKR